jgi:hypothetical protein
VQFSMIPKLTILFRAKNLTAVSGHHAQNG